MSTLDQDVLLQETLRLPVKIRLHAYVQLITHTNKKQLLPFLSALIFMATTSDPAVVSLMAKAPMCSPLNN